MGKEDNLFKKVGTGNPFIVPDQYFERFTQELMEKLPEKEPLFPMPEPTLWQRVKPWLYMTAMFCGIMLSVRIFVGEPRKDEFPITQSDAEILSDEDWEIIVRNTYINDYALYEYLTEAETNH